MKTRFFKVCCFQTPQLVPLLGGGLNANYSCAGDAGIGFDFEYAIRLWKLGHSVGLAELGFNHGGEEDSAGGGCTSCIQLTHSLQPFYL